MVSLPFIVKGLTPAQERADLFNHLMCCCIGNFKKGVVSSSQVDMFAIQTDNGIVRAGAPVYCTGLIAGIRVNHMALAPDGKTISMPDGELTSDGTWYAIDTV